MFWDHGYGFSHAINFTEEQRLPSSRMTQSFTLRGHQILSHFVHLLLLALHATSSTRKQMGLPLPTAAKQEMFDSFDSHEQPGRSSGGGARQELTGAQTLQSLPTGGPSGLHIGSAILPKTERSARLEMSASGTNGGNGTN